MGKINKIYIKIILENDNEKVRFFENQEQFLIFIKKLDNDVVKSFRFISIFHYYLLYKYINRKYYAKIIMKNGEKSLFSSTSKYLFKTESLSPEVESFHRISERQFRKQMNQWARQELLRPKL